MYKLIILFEQSVPSFEQQWQKFLQLAEKMPGLRREAISRPDRVVAGGGGNVPLMIHELIFDSRRALEAAIASGEGRAAGQMLQSFTGGRVTVLTAEHMEARAAEFRKVK